MRDRRLPEPVKLSEPKRMPRAAVVILTVGGLLLTLILARLSWSLTEPMPIVAAPLPQTSALDFSTMPTAAPFPSQIAVVILPTATPVPRPTVASLPTLVPLFCGMGSDYGDVCVWPLPTPTPDPGPPPCVTPEPKESCRWRGWPRVTSDDA